MVFGVGQFNYASDIWLGHTLVAMAKKICDFQHKIGYNSTYAGDTPPMLAPTGGGIVGLGQFSGVMVTKNWEFYQKICHNFGCI